MNTRRWTTNIAYDHYWDQYIVRLFDNGVIVFDGAYFTKDKKDAENTARQMVAKGE